ncbi:putative transcription factor FAR family [Helianthus annuus]|nr:putative transcription factor FAR family [Helianthus annuus]
MSSLCHDPTPTRRAQSTCQQEEVAWNDETEGLSVDVDKQQTISEDDVEKIELPARGELNTCEADKNQEPCEGMLFESDEAARTFYDDYAGRVGFVTRVLSSRKSERDGTIISRGLGCRGDIENHKKETVTVKKKNKGRENCAAMILVKRQKPGNWVVRKFIKEHNHPLRVSVLQRRPLFDEKDKRIQELSAELRVKKRLTASYREQLLAIMKDVDGHNEYLSSKVEIVRNNLKKLEANILQGSDTDQLPYVR